MPLGVTTKASCPHDKSDESDESDESDATEQ